MRRRLRRLWRRLLVLIALLVLAALGLAAHTLWFRPLRIEWFFQRIAIEDLLADPERRSQQPLLPRLLEPAHRRLTDLSPRSAAAAERRANERLVTLRGYDCAQLDVAAAESCAVLEHVLRLQVEGARWRLFDHPVNPVFGLHNSLPGVLIGQQPLASKDDAEDYLARLQAVAEKIDSLLLSLQAQSAAGIHPPRAMVDAVIEQLTHFAEAAADQNVLYIQFKRRLQRVDAERISASQAEALLERAAEAIEASVRPAWRRLLQHFQAIRPAASRNDGVWSLPDGDAYYAYRVRLQTSTELTPDAVHALGLAEVERLSRRADRALRALSLTTGSVGERFAQLGQDPGQRFSDDLVGRAAILAALKALVADARTRSIPLFPPLPPSELLVARVPEARQDSAPGAYYSPPMGEDSLTGTLYLNLRNVAELPRFALPALAFHEGVPGHHLQAIAQLEQRELPAFRRALAFPAYAEGWAMYAEQLAGEAGMANDAYAHLGLLQSELFRAARLVVDTGLHHQRWSREQAIRYLRDSTGLALSDAQAEVDRYLVFPAQALSFSIGLRCIRQLRETAMHRLGPRFDLREFHAAVLNGGRVPLTVLEQRVERYIAAREVEHD